MQLEVIVQGKFESDFFIDLALVMKVFCLLKTAIDTIMIFHWFHRNLKPILMHLGKT